MRGFRGQGWATTAALCCCRSAWHRVPMSPAKPLNPVIRQPSVRPPVMYKAPPVKWSGWQGKGRHA